MPEISERIRAFVALRLNPDTEDAIVALINDLRRMGGNISWSRRDNLHVTLRFLGNAVPAAMIAAVAPALSQIAATVQPFELDARGAGAFPDLRRPRVIWIGTTATPLFILARKIEDAVQACGFDPESRAYSAHLTIGRVRDLRGWAPLRQCLVSNSERDFGVSRIETISLYRSRLGREGATYEELGRYPLADIPLPGTT